MVLLHAANILVNGLVRRQQPDAFSMSLPLVKKYRLLLADASRALSTRYPEAGLEVYVTSDGSDVYEDQFRDIAARDDSKTIRPTLILLGVRLGIERITPVYWGALQEMLRLPQSVGIAG